MAFPKSGHTSWVRTAAKVSLSRYFPVDESSIHIHYKGELPLVVFADQVFFQKQDLCFDMSACGIVFSRGLFIYNKNLYQLQI